MESMLGCTSTNPSYIFAFSNMSCSINGRRGREAPPRALGRASLGLAREWPCEGPSVELGGMAEKGLGVGEGGKVAEGGKAPEAVV